MSSADFRHYWKEIHAPIALSIPNLLRYEQNHVLGPAAGASGTAPLLQQVDGLCQLQFESEAAMRSVLTPEMTRVLLEDEARFIEGLQTFVIAQRRVLPPVDPAAGVKCIALVGRKPEIDRARFEQGWGGEYAEALKSAPGLLGCVQNLVTDRTIARRPARYEELPIDCIDELWFEDEAAMERFFDGRSLPLVAGAIHAMAGTLDRFTVRAHAPQPLHASSTR